MPTKDFLENAKPVQQSDFLADAKPVVTPPPEVPPTMMQQAGTMAKDFGIGALKGAGSTANNIGHLLYPDWLAKHLTGAPSAEQQEGYFKPANPTQSVGKGIEQAAEFLAPGGAEKTGAVKLAELAPRLGKMAAPLARVATSALSAGAVNKAQGGNFSTGALAGGIGSGGAEVLRMAAPSIAESALNIRKLDRAYKPKGAIGHAILNDTRGITPGRVAESAQGKLDVLNPQLNAMADRASVRPNPARRLLTAPPQEIPLGEPFIRDVKGELIPAAPFPRGNIVGGNSSRVASELGSTESTIPPRLTRDDLYMTSGIHEPQPLPTSGPGVLLRKPAAAGGPIPTHLANPIASLSPARGTLGHALGTASRQGERTTAAQLQPMAQHLGETMEGVPISENITPRQLLDLKRGFGNEFIHRWNPETMTGVKGTAGRVYHAMGQEFNRTVPGAKDLNSQISNLIPVAKRAESAELNAPTSQRVFNRVAAHTGALAGGIGAGALGYKEGGLPKALEYGGIGLLAPELIASPEGQMAIARTLNSSAPRVMTKALTGAGLTATRQRKGGSK